MKIIQEFKTFALRGNVIDLAVGVVIGASFNSITNSLVNDIINPLIGMLTGRVDLSDKVIVLKEAIGDAPALTVNYGNFISSALNFLIIAFVLFLFIRQINKLTQREEAKNSAAEPAKS
jgi:large conductance mechanosensitive channel